MKGISKQQEVLSVISKCLKDYDKNLRAKKIMFIIEDKNRNIKKEEVYFPKSSFYHLTGVTVMDKKEKELNSYDFYDNIRDGKITPNKYIIKNKDKTTDLKLHFNKYKKYKKYIKKRIIKTVHVTESVHTIYIENCYFNNFRIP